MDARKTRRRGQDCDKMRGSMLGTFPTVSRAVLQVTSFFLVALATVPAAAAQEPSTRVVLASDDAELAGALTAALGPWRVEVIVLRSTSPGASLPGSARRGREITEAARAVAATWVSTAPDGAALWVYDRASDRVIARPLSAPPPFDEATSAAIALAIKTLLRYSSAAPPAERLVTPPELSKVRVELAGGLRALSTSPADLEPRGGLGIVLWPGWLARAVGLALVVRGGSGIDVQNALVAGRYWTVDVHAGVRGRWSFLGRQLDASVGLELGATFSILDGHVLPEALHVTPASADPSAFLWVELGVRPIPTLRLAARAGAFAIARTRTYLVRGEPAVDTSPLAAIAELVVELPLDGGTLDPP